MDSQRQEQQLPRSLIYGGLLLAVVLCYGKVVSFEWLNWDDDWLVLSNKLIQNCSLQSIWRLCSDFTLATRLQLGAEFLPLRDLSFMVQWRLFGNWAGGFHLINALLYFISLLALHATFIKQRHSPLVAGLAVLFFAVHPIHVEPVAWIAGHRDILSFFFFCIAMLTLEHFLEEKRRRWALLTAAAFLCSILSKYAAIVFPAYALMRFFFTQRLRPTKKIDLQQLLWLVVPLVAISLMQLYVVFKVSAAVQMIGKPLSDSAWQTFVTMLNVFRLYVGKLFWPAPLSPKYNVDVLTVTSTLGLTSLMFAASILAIFALLIVQLRAPRLTKELATKLSDYLFWGLWFFVALIPVSQIFAIQNKMADRYLLLSSIAFAVIVAMAAEQSITWAKKRHLASTRLIVLFYLSLTMVYGWQTFCTVDHWRDSIALWSHAAAVDPSNQTAFYQLSQSFKAAGNYDAERETLKRLLHLNPNHEQALNNYAINLAQHHGSTYKVMELYEKLLQINPRNTKALHNYAQVLIENGRQNEAVVYLQRAIQLDATYCRAMTTLAKLQQQRGEAAAANKLLQQAEKCYHAGEK